MVHALRQAYRVLKLQGYLLDMRPAPVHRHVGIEYSGQYEEVAVMKEDFDDDYAANRALKEVLQADALIMKRRVRFNCIRRMDRFNDFTAWLDEYVRLRKIRSHESLLEKVQATLSARSEKAQIVVRGPIDLRVLSKVNRVYGSSD